MLNNYKNTWLAFVEIVPKEGYNFNELIDSTNNSENYNGAWANVIIKANSIKDALDIIPLGFDEKMFNVKFIDKIENISSLIEYEEIDNSIINEVDWLLSSEFVFLISDKLFPYVD